MHNKICLLIVVLMILHPASMRGDGKRSDVEKHDLSKVSIMEITDRAVGVHDASNIGLYFSNYGRISRGSLSYRYAGEYPINSDHNYIWKLIPLVGVAPDRASNRAANVIQSMDITAPEWEAMPNFHSPGKATIAFSDDASTWPASVWFFQDEADNPLIVSSQDSYCAYNDANNSIEVLGIQTIKTGYAFANPDIKDMLFFKFEITNQSQASYDSVYFGFYHDFDIGGGSDWSDDDLEFDASNNFIWFYDSDNYSVEWGSQPGTMGIALMESPFIDGSMAGITDMHFNKRELEDSTLIAILSSNLEYLPGGVSPDNYFNTGATANIHFDDPELIPQTGMDTHGTISSGPFDLSPTDTLTFVVCIVAGVDTNDLFTNLAAAQDLYAKNFRTARPPATPVLNGIAGDGYTTLYWTDELEDLPDEASEVIDFEGYNLFRSVDAGLNWDQINRNQVSTSGLDPVPLASFDHVNGIGEELGMAYSYQDEAVINGLEYWYSLTAFDHGDSITARLESAIGNKPEVKNMVSLTPQSSAINHINSYGTGVRYIGSGRSNYELNVDPVSPDLLDTYRYILRFDYVPRIEVGDPGIIAIPVIPDSTLTQTTHYGLRFSSSTEFDVYNRTTQEILATDIGLYFGFDYPFPPGLFVNLERDDTDNTPEAGDYMSMNFCASLFRVLNSDTVMIMSPQQFDLDRPLVSDDGLLLNFAVQPTLQDINTPPLLDFNIDFEVIDELAVVAASYQISITGSGTDASNDAYLVFQVLRDGDTLIVEADTLFNLWTTVFDGVGATISFDPASLPSVGTSATLTAAPPVSPHIQDAYSFGINTGSMNPIETEAELSQITVVPNPYVAGSLWESGLGSVLREPVRQLQFINLPAECEIRIFTLSGNLIKTLQHDAAHGTEVWDLRAEGGREITSGIYLYQVKSAGKEYLNRFAVIK